MAYDKKIIEDDKKAALIKVEAAKPNAEKRSKEIEETKTLERIRCEQEARMKIERLKAEKAAKLNLPNPQVIQY